MKFWKKVIEEYLTLKIVIGNLQFSHLSNQPKDLASTNEPKFFRIFIRAFYVKRLIEEYLKLIKVIVNLQIFYLSNQQESFIYEQKYFFRVFIKAFYVKFLDRLIEEYICNVEVRHRKSIYNAFRI